MTKGTIRTGLAAALALAVLGAAPAGAQVEKIETIATRTDIKLRFAMMTPQGGAVGAVILFKGGDGKVGLWDPKVKKKGLGVGRNFLVRSRFRFAANGFLTLTVDVPTDRQKKGLRGFRRSAEHAEDIRFLVAFIRRRAKFPVWLVGNSRGSESVAHIAARLGVGEIQGIVLTSAITRQSGSESETVLDANFGRIVVPVLIVNHRDDACTISPYYDVTRIEGDLTRTRATETLVFQGGAEPKSKACGQLSAHGFLGLENRVVDTISRWIKVQSRR